MLPAASSALGRLSGPNEIIVTDDVVTPAEQSILVNWAEENFRDGRLLNNPRDPRSYSTPYFSAGRRTLTPLTEHRDQSQPNAPRKLVWIPQVRESLSNNLPEVFWQIRARVISRLELSELEEDPYKGSFLNYIVPGGEVHAHRDDRLRVNGEELLLLRCNVLYKRPLDGGQPLISQQELDVGDRGMWTFYPTELVHAATEVCGNEHRGTLSFGFVVRFKALWQRLFKVGPILGQLGGSAEPVIALLRGHSDGKKISEDQLELMRFLLTRKEQFSIEQVANCFGIDESVVWEMVRHLHSLNLLESASSLCTERGRILVS